MAVPLESGNLNRVEPIPVEDLSVARTLSKAIDTFEGDWEHAVEWMRTPNPSLENQAPFQVAREPFGHNRVLAVLTRIEHGIIG